MGYVTVLQDGPVSIVVFERGAQNFFDLGLIKELADTFEEIDRRPEQRAIVLASQGKVFCAGADFNDPAVREAEPGALYREALRLFRCRKPVVAAIQGAAIGGGLGLALVADFRVAAPEARFSANFVQIGIHPGFGLTWTLPRLIGERAAALLFLTGRRINGEKAAEIGLVEELVPLSDLRSAAVALAQELAGGAPLAVQATRQTLRGDLADAVARQTDLELAEQLRLFETDDFREGVRAITERRPGNWSAT
ncbi:enoyl-CoA hydratase/isomerase family protein [Azospirillum endophyticum]